MVAPNDKHISFRWLLERHDKRLSGVRAESVESHLATVCATCDETLDGIARMTTGVREGPLPSPPRAAIRRARRLFVSRKIAHAVERAREVVARLVFDQRSTPALALRTARGSSRRLLWNLGDLEMFAVVTAGAGGFSLEGQILPTEDDGCAVVSGSVFLASGGRSVARVSLDPEGRFRFTGLSRGTWAMEGEAEGVAFRVPPFVVDAG